VADWGVIDLEWDGNVSGQPLLVLGWRRTAYAADSIPDSVWAELQDPSITKVAFTKSDHRWILEHGYSVRGPFHDIQVMAWCIDERTELSLEAVARIYGAPPKDERLVRRGGKILFLCDDKSVVPIAEAPIEQLMEYNEGDLSSEEALYLMLKARLHATDRYDYWYTRHVPYSDVLLRMEMEGLPINVFKTKVEERKLRKDVESRSAALHVEAELPEEFNLESKDQLANYLFKREFEWPTRYRLDKDTIRAAKAGEWPAGLPTDFEPIKVGREYITGFRRLKGRGIRAIKKAPKCAARGKPDGCGHDTERDCSPSVSAKVLKVYHGDDLWVQSFCEYKLRSKGLQFLRVWIEDNKGGRIYARFNQTGTDTGRLSSSDPNLQQVPSRGELGKRFRRLFQAPKDLTFIHADFDQIEPRLSAHYSQDPFLLDVFRRGVDLYEELTVQLLGARYPKGTPERQLSRTCFLAQEYGAKPRKIRSNLAEEGFRFSLRQVTDAWEGVRAAIPVFVEWTEEVFEQSEQDGYVETIGGHRRHISWLNPDMRWKSENQSVNSKIQGSAADITQGTMLVIDRALPEVHLVAAVHDELLGLVEKRHATSDVLLEFQAAGEWKHGFRLEGVALGFKAHYIENWGQAK